MSRIEKMEKTVINRRKDQEATRHRSAPKRDEIKIDDENENGRFNASKRQERTKKFSVAATHRTSSSQGEAKEFKSQLGKNVAGTNHKTQDNRQREIGDEQSVGSVFKPYNKQSSVDNNS